ncbi:MAG: hypothetical protein ACOC44_08160 [Promethearchaeia archaeon]
MPFTKEDIEVLAYRRYKSGEPYEKSVWYLAELVCTINKNIRNADSIHPLETDNLVLLLKENIDGKLAKPTRDEVEEISELIYKSHPEKSKLHWFIAEKSLLLEEIKNILEGNNKE